MPDLQHAIAELCFELEKAQTYTRVRELLLSAAGAFGTSFYLLGMRTGRTISPPAQIVISNYPRPWRRYYDEQGAYAFDPVINRAFQSAGAFRWDGLHKDERQLALRRESVRNGMAFGFSCSDRGPDSSLAILSFCGREPIAPEPAQWEITEVAVRLLASTAHKAVIAIIESRAGTTSLLGNPLTDAERRSLEMMASAMTAKQAAAVLGVQPRTVRYYLDRAAEKLGVDTRREAVIKALADSIIDTRKFPKAGFETSMDIDD
ncbi:LuxR family transcriptional regulator [Hydrocarboniphaga sp.]|uniref:LuxR family transcriptional regulator n=1 Tax=Hydrocarboniphaga sp. TaxID=2033016 RepID=UPI002ABB4FD2|nr:LuxR family transcriptional regulator [Hydrocarboniphaga sp.]MDZ4078494.1 LuxR family transcriptional regulator [Hydrocarboniphaga sp.]